MSANVYETHDYDLFELLPFNRKLRSLKRLDRSMRKHGWIDAFPMGVVKNGNGKLLIKFGHHRFITAKTLHIPVKYVFVPDGISVFEMEETYNKWDMKDFLHGSVQLGKADYLKVQEYHEDTGISLNQCVSMLGGQSAGSGNLRKAFIAGTFRLSNMVHAKIVGDIVKYCRNLKVPFATNNLFVKALSKVIWANGFDPDIFKRKVRSHPYLLETQPCVDDYIKLIEVIYNRQSKDKLPLAFLADQAAKDRSAAKPK